MHNDNLDKLTNIVEDAIGLLSRKPGQSSSEQAPEGDSASAVVAAEQPQPRKSFVDSILNVEKFEFSEECSFSHSSEIGEKFRELRTNIQTLSVLNKINTFVISSCHHHEGKTHVAINTARFLAQFEDRKILLVDCDIRKPKIKNHIKFEFEHGLEDVLSGKCSIEDAIVFSSQDNLAVLPTLSGRSAATELLESPVMSRVIEDIRKAYDYVIIDTSPVLSTTDPLVVGARADGIIMAIKTGATQRDTVEHAMDLLRQANVRVFGIVLTQMKNYIPKYLYRYQYFYDAYADYYASENPADGKTKGKKRRKRR